MPCILTGFPGPLEETLSPQVQRSSMLVNSGSFLYNHSSFHAKPILCVCCQTALLSSNLRIEPGSNHSQ